MGVSLDPQALGHGGNQFASHAEALAKDATSVADLAAVQSAYAGAGESAWQAVAPLLTDLQGKLQALGERATTTGAGLGTIANVFPTLDNDNAKSMNDSGAGM